jgi:hypothetical protein
MSVINLNEEVDLQPVEETPEQELSMFWRLEILLYIVELTI